MRACDNPFAVHRTERLRFRLDAAGWESLLDRWRRQRGRGALIGPHGSGKSRLLGELGQKLRDDGLDVRLLRWTADQRPSPSERAAALRALGPRSVLLIDGAEQTGALEWWRFEAAARGAGGLVITTHRAGRLAALYEHRTSPALLDGLVEELVGGEGARALAPLCQALFERHAGNLRDCLRSLYDVHAERPAR